jgi:hypothetical protein
MAKETTIEKLIMLPHILGFVWGILFAFEFWEIYTMPNSAQMIKYSTRHELIDFIAAVVALIAVGVSFIWPVAGGLVMMLAYIAMATVERQVFVGPVFPIVFITGMLHVVLHVIHMRSAQVEGQTN